MSTQSTGRPRSAPKRFHSSSELKTGCCCYCWCANGGAREKGEWQRQSHHPCCLGQESMIDKDHQLHKLSDEVSRLAIYEGESQRKDKLIASLRDEVSSLQKTLRAKGLRLTSQDEEIATAKLEMQEIESEMNKMRERNVELESRIKAAIRQTTSLQSQLSEKTALLSTHCDELKQLRKERREVADDLASSHEEKREKQVMIASLQDRVKRLQAMKNELQNRLEASQKEQVQAVQNENAAIQEISKLKNKNAQMSQLKLLVTSLEQQLTEAKSNCSELACKLSKAEDQLCKLLYQLMPMVGLHTSSRNGGREEESKSVVAAVTTLACEQVKLKQELEFVVQQKEEIESDRASLITSITELTTAALVSSLTPLSCGTVASKLQELEVDEELRQMQDAIVHVFSSLGSTLNQLETIKSQTETALVQNLEEPETQGEDKEEAEKEEEEEEGARKDESAAAVLIQVQKLVSKLKQVSTQCQHLEDRVAVLQEQQPVMVNQMVSSLQQEHQQQLLAAVEKARREEKEEAERMIQEARSECESDKKVAVQQEKDQLAAAQSELGNMKAMLASREAEILQKEAEVENLLQHKSTLDARMVELEAKLSSLEMSTSEDREVASASWKARETEMMKSVEGYKVQCEQHALTIVALEDKLLASVHEVTQLRGEKAELQSKIRELEEQIVVLSNQNTLKQQQHKQTVEALQRQLNSTRGYLDRETAHSHTLTQKLLNSAQNFKDAQEKSSAEFSIELQDLKKSLACREKDVVSQKEELSQLKVQLSEREGKLKEKTEEHEKLLKIVGRIAEEKKEEKANDSLLSLGKRCLGERHHDTIQSQGTAISELRKRINDLVTASPPAPSHQAALKELARVRQELAHFKAEQMVKEKQVATTAMKEKWNPPIQLVQRSSAQNHHHLADMKEALQQSEQSYQNLLEAVCRKLSIPEQDPYTNRSLENTNRVDRVHVMKERDQFIKEDLEHAVVPQGRSRKPTRPSSASSADETVDSATARPTSVLHLVNLKPDLKPLGVYQNPDLEKLDQQKRLHQAITKRQEFKMSQERKAPRVRSHSCLITPADSQHKVEEMRRSYIAKLDQKNHEMTLLRTELNSSRQQNNMLSMQLRTLQTTS